MYISITFAVALTLFSQLQITSKIGSDTFKFWHAYALAQQGSPLEAIRELSVLEGNPDTALAVRASHYKLAGVGGEY